MTYRYAIDPSSGALMRIADSTRQFTPPTVTPCIENGCGEPRWSKRGRCEAHAVESNARAERRRADREARRAAREAARPPRPPMSVEEALRIAQCLMKPTP